MDETEYHNICDELFMRIESVLDDAGVDYESNGGMIEVLLDDDGKVVINRQPALQEVWVAARSGGHHFVWRDGGWHDTRSGGTLSNLLLEVVGVGIQ
ncbi:iron donor protein CyaY [Candidatus Persebacteraceae bacterium Df01]|jgi:CyaY protein|uniref:Iron-sulfur cluster assembly protein CyaY n=1 Tax=Candidatus Doriopsillibacter californiensis TaxID=2970740 RepID=A0ABT7QJJ3_9GAMM|nr:iron donor protein CyaY [Candidatus Persebacteraceae bacterium Df01]